MVPTSPAASRRAEIPPNNQGKACSGGATSRSSKRTSRTAMAVEEGQHVQISAADVWTFSVGEKVNAMWQGKRQLYPATVKAFHSYENSYDLEYDDGDSETRVPSRAAE